MGPRTSHVEVKWLKSGRGSLPASLAPSPLPRPASALSTAVATGGSPHLAPSPPRLVSSFHCLHGVHMRSHLLWPKIAPHLRCPLELPFSFTPFFHCVGLSEVGCTYCPVPAGGTFSHRGTPPAVYWHFTACMSVTRFIGC